VLFQHNDLLRFELRGHQEDLIEDLFGGGFTMATMVVTMVATTRQPFAPLDGSRLQHLRNIKNRQNGMLNHPTIFTATYSLFEQ